MSSIARTCDSIENLNREFIGVLSRLSSLIESTPADSMYHDRSGRSGESVGENAIKCAGTLEQTFGGLTTNLWDDPFEWTLPETLSTPDLIQQYLAEVDSARIRALASLVDDSALDKYIALPSGDQTTIRNLLLNALETARNYERKATEMLKTLVADDAPRFII
jgi:hypothetical protein